MPVKTFTRTTEGAYDVLSEVMSVTIDVAGKYLILASGSSYNTTGNGTIELYLYKNNVNPDGYIYRDGGSTSSRYIFGIHILMDLDKNDKISLYAQPVDGGRATIRAGATITAIRVG